MNIVFSRTAFKRVGCRTQKSLPLLKRIVAYASNNSDAIPDLFVGERTTMTTIERLKRRRTSSVQSTTGIKDSETRLRNRQKKHSFFVGVCDTFAQSRLRRFCVAKTNSDSWHCRRKEKKNFFVFFFVYRIKETFSF